MYLLFTIQIILSTLAAIPVHDDNEFVHNLIFSTIPIFAVSSMFLFIYWIYKRRKIPQFSHVSKIPFCYLVICEDLLFDVYLYYIFSQYPIPNKNILNDSQS